MFEKLIDNWRAVLLAVVVHALIAGLLVFGVQFVRDSASSGDQGERIINAAVVNPDSADAQPSTADNKVNDTPEPDAEAQAAEAAREKAEADNQARAQAEREAEQKARAEAERKAEAERQAQEKARQQAEAKREAAEQAAREKAQAEAKRKAAAEQAAREKAEAERQAKAEAEAEREAREEAERQAKAEAERQAREEAERQARAEAEREAREEAERQAASQRAVEEQRAREQALQAAIAKESAGNPSGSSTGRTDSADAQVRAAYIRAISDRVEANWIRPPGASNISCRVRVRQLPGGQVTGVELLGSCGSAAVDRSVEQAIYKSDPLPTPASSDLFDPVINFKFEPDQ